MRDKIRVFALGGLDERGKNIVVVELMMIYLSSMLELSIQIVLYQV